MRELVERRKDRHWRFYDTEQYTIINGQTKKLYRATYQKGQNYKNLLTGKWEDYDGNWEHDDTADPQGNQFGWKVKKSDTQLRIFAQNPNKKWMRIGFAPGVFVQYSIPNVEPSYIGNTALFVDAWSNTDMRLTASPEGVKNDVILKAPGHPASFSFPISVTGCSAQVEGNTLVYYRDSEPIARIPTPWMEDANGERGEVSLSYDGQVVTFTPDDEWLKTAAYPVTVDPTTALQGDPAMEDAYIASNYPNNNYSTGYFLKAGSNFDVSAWYRGFFKPPVPEGMLPENVISATVKFYIYWVYANLNFNVYFRPVLEPWTASTVTWNNQPAIEGVNIASFYTAYETWGTANITAYMQNPKEGLAVLGFESAKSCNLASGNYDTVAYRPIFEYEYTEGSTGTDIVKVVTDAMGISETMLKTRGRLRVFTDALDVTETTAKARDRFKIVSDSISLAEMFSRARARVKIVSNQIDIAENRTRLRNILRVVDDTVGLTEALTKARNRFKVISDTVGLLESIVKQLIRRIIKHAPDYTWREIPERYSTKELLERYQATEILPRYIWKELK